MPPYGHDASRRSSPSIEANPELENLPLNMTPSPTPPASPPLWSPLPVYIPQLIELPDVPPQPLIYEPMSLFYNGLFDCLPIDHNLSHTLSQVCGTEDLLTVETLTLRVVSIQMSLQRLAFYVPNLTELILDNSCITSLRDLGTEFKFLQKLSVANCGLDSLDGAFAFNNLRELRAARNEIKDVGQCMFIPHLKVIDLRRNAISDIVRVKFLFVCLELEELTLAECPAALEPNYRAIVGSFLPRLRILDGIPIENSQREWPYSTDDNNSDEDDDNDDDEEYKDRGDGTWRSASASERYSNEGSSHSCGDSTSSLNLSPSSPDGNNTGCSDNNTRCSKMILPPINQRPATALPKASAIKYEHRKDRPATTGSNEIKKDLKNKKHHKVAFSLLSNQNTDLGFDKKAKGNSENLQKRTTNYVNKPDMSIETFSSSMVDTAQEDIYTNSDPLLKASQNWRKMYHAYRLKNRERWSKKTQEKYDSQNEEGHAMLQAK